MSWVAEAVKGLTTVVDYVRFPQGAGLSLLVAAVARLVCVSAKREIKLPSALRHCARTTAVDIDQNQLTSRSIVSLFTSNGRQQQINGKKLN